MIEINLKLTSKEVQKVFPEAVSDQNPDELDSAKNRITELENK